MATERATSEIVLIQPPVVIPSAVQSGLPHLVGSLRANDIEPSVLGLGIDLVNAIMTADVQRDLLAECKARLAELDSKDGLTGREILEYGKLVEHASLSYLPDAVEDALEVFRSERIYDFEEYNKAARCATDAIGLFSATLFPFEVSSLWMRSPLYDVNYHSSDLFAAIDEYDEIQDRVGAKLFSKILHDSLPEKAPKLVGISIGYASQFVYGFWVAREIKRRFPETFIVVGGPTVAKLAHAGHEEGRWPLCHVVDAVALGDGEKIIVNLAQRLLAGKPVEPANNLLLHDPVNNCGHMLELELIHDLNQTAMADYSLSGLEKYWTPEPLIPFTVSRGCYWDRCTFCYYGLVTDENRVTQVYREMSPDEIVRRMKLQNERCGATMFNFTTDSASPPWLLRIAKKLAEEGLDHLKWTVMARAEKNFTAERVKTLNKGGCIYIYFGVESADDQVLKDIDKGTNADQYERVITDCYNAGIATGMLGFFDFPTEDFAAAKRSLDFLTEHQDVMSGIQWGYFFLEKGAIAYKNPERYGIAEMFEDGSDLGGFVTYRLEKEMKTEEEREFIDKGLREVVNKFHLNFERPFLVGARCSHSALYYRKFGPAALKEFVAYIGKSEERLREKGEDLKLQLNVDITSSRYNFRDILELREKVDKFVKDGRSFWAAPTVRKAEVQPTQGGGGLVALKAKKPSPTSNVSLTRHRVTRLERLALWDKENEPFKPEQESSMAIVTPWKNGLVNEATMELLTFFEEPKTLGEASEEFEVDLEDLYPVLFKALDGGWVKVVD